MIRVTTKIESKGDAGKRLQEILKGLKGPTMVKVGLPSGKADASIIQIAFWNHEGTSRQKGDVFFRNGKFGISGPIPPRPFLTQAMFKHRNTVKTQLRNEAAKIMRGQGDMQQALQRIGIGGADAIKATISAGVGPANSPMTVYLKGSSKPLIDEGRLRGSITWALDK